MKKINTKTYSLFLIIGMCLISQTIEAQNISFIQQIGVFKKLKGDLTTIGVLSSNLSDKASDEIQRGSQQLGIKIFIAKPSDIKDVPVMYKTLVSEKKVQFVWVPTSDDPILTAFEFLKENAIPDKIGLCVPNQSLLDQGGLIFVTRDNGKITAYVNQKMAAFVGITMPSSDGSSVNFVSK